MHFLDNYPVPDSARKDGMSAAPATADFVESIFGHASWFGRPWEEYRTRYDSLPDHRDEKQTFSVPVLSNTSLQILSHLEAGNCIHGKYGTSKEFCEYPDIVQKTRRKGM